MLLFSTRMQVQWKGENRVVAKDGSSASACVDLFPGAAYHQINPHEISFMITETISHYRVLSQLGGTGSGVVYEVEDLSTRVAPKGLPPDFEPDAETRASCERESLAASALNPPNICKVYEFGESDGR